MFFVDFQLTMWVQTLVREKSPRNFALRDLILSGPWTGPNEVAESGPQSLRCAQSLLGLRAIPARRDASRAAYAAKPQSTHGNLRRAELLPCARRRRTGFRRFPRE